MSETTPTTHNGPIVELADVTKSYGETHEVLHGITMTIARGEALAIVGPSGSGKSTLLNVIGALTPATSGDVRIDGRPLANRTDNELSELRNTTIGFVFQSHHLLPQCSALENVLVPSIVSHSQDGVAQRARALLERVGLADRMTHRPREMSGGECQRVAVARAMINEPSLLLADEPTGSLDEETADQLAELLAEINSERGVTLVTVTHSRRLADQMQRQVALRSGHIESEVRV